VRCPGTRRSLTRGSASFATTSTRRNPMLLAPEARNRDLFSMLVSVQRIQLLYDHATPVLPFSQGNRARLVRHTASFHGHAGTVYGYAKPLNAATSAETSAKFADWFGVFGVPGGCVPTRSARGIDGADGKLVNF